MTEPGHYPPPDFGCPPPNSIQPFQHQPQPRSSSFHPSMWSWGDTPSEPGWDYSGQAGWHNGAAPWFGSPGHHENYGPTRPYGQHFGHQWHRGGRQNYGPANNHGRKQNKKKEPEFSHFCDTCDRGFKNQEKYDEHVSQHVKCSVPDCTFMAHEKIVSIHWKNSHAPGTKRIKLDTPDEIAKWREERRKNYPTLQNIEKKKKVMELREETGAVLETAQFGRMRGRGRGRGWGRGHGWGNRGFRGHHPQGPHPFNSGATERNANVTPCSRDGDPLGALASSDHDSDKDDLAAESKTSGLIVAPKQMSSALGSLLANYGSMSESESDEEPEAVPVQKAKDLVQENQALLNTTWPTIQDTAPSTGLKSFSRGTEAHTGCQPDSFSPNHNQRGRGGRRGRGRRGGHRGIPQSRRPTLLEMLLAPDIRHERNVLLQCVRYVVRNNFFGLEPQSRPQNQGAMMETPAPAITGKQKEQSEKNSSEPLPPFPGEEMRSSAGNPGDLETIEAVVEDKICQEQECDHVYTEPSKETVDSEARAELTAEDFTQCVDKAAEKGNCSLDLTSDKITCSSNIYDDEIWESPSAVL